MSLENTLERIATALEKIAERHGNGGSTVIHADAIDVTASVAAADAAAAEATKKIADEKRMADAQANADKLAAKKKVEAAAKKVADDAAAAEKAKADAEANAAKSKFTLDDVRGALKSYRDLEGSAAMLDMLKKYGAEALKDIDPAKYDELMADITA